MQQSFIKKYRIIKPNKITDKDRKPVFSRNQSYTSVQRPQKFRMFLKPNMTDFKNLNKYQDSYGQPSASIITSNNAINKVLIDPNFAAPIHKLFLFKILNIPYGPNFGEMTMRY